jgi:hypothetical protein
VPYEPHRDLILPPDDTVLWRYMDFAKFVYLLEKQMLWFPRADQLEDPKEGTFTDGELKAIRCLDAQNTESDSRPPSEGYRWAANTTRVMSYISCWRAGSHESLAMWDIFGKGSGIVAVKTTVGNLKQAIDESPLRILLGGVKYIDWDLVYWDLFNSIVLCCRKDLSYQHEAEVRAIISDIGTFGEPLIGQTGIGISLRGLCPVDRNEMAHESGCSILA